MAAASRFGANVERVDLRDLQIHHCRGCYYCADSGICVQNDDFEKLKLPLHLCDAVVLAAPIYYNCLSSQTMTAINRLCYTFACKQYQFGPPKKVGIFLTCTGSSPEEMQHQVDNIFTLPSIRRAVVDYKTEVFTDCNELDSCALNEAYLERARAMAAWVCQRISLL